MKNLAIKAEGISKQYRLGEVGTGTIIHDLNRFWSKIRGKEDPYIQIGDLNDRTSKSTSDYIWSLKDINFEIEQGDAVGIIGKNGAGKSTLLKLLSKVTKPTTGSFKVNGRIASLLEIGTGFNPDMTGRENIYLNGAILGMRRQEIKRKFEEIVDFSGVEKYIDTPVKRYSSGMYVRLAFAVAAHLESEILIVDEVLSFGDAEFQKKCLGKMEDVSSGEGRTVLFVSHSLASVKTLCSKGILLKQGQINFQGNIEDTLNAYLLNNEDQVYGSKIIYDFNELKEAQILKMQLKDVNGEDCIEYYSNQDIYVHLTVFNHIDKQRARINFSIYDKYESLIFTGKRELDFRGTKTLIIKIPKNNLIGNTYLIGASIDIPNMEILDMPDKKIKLSIISLEQEESIDGIEDKGIFKVPISWTE